MGLGEGGKREGGKREGEEEGGEGLDNGITQKWPAGLDLK